MTLRIDLKIFPFLLLLILSKQLGSYITIILFLICHELGHLIAGLILKMKVKNISIMPAGFSINFALTKEDFNRKILNSRLLEIKKIIIAIAGPFTNILLIILSCAIYKQGEFVYQAIYSNILIATFNLLPIYPLDGGRILKSILCLILGKRKSIYYINKISNIMLFIITFGFSILLYSLKNWAVLVILICLWYIVLRENKVLKLKMKLYASLEEIET